MWEPKRKGKDSITALKNYAEQYAPSGENKNYVGKVYNILKKHNAIQGNTTFNPNKTSGNMDETQQQWINFNKELQQVRNKYSGTELDKVESNIVKKYKDLGYIPAFNELQGKINDRNKRIAVKKAESAATLANSLNDIIGPSNIAGFSLKNGGLIQVLMML